jgi:glycosyltransferase involved in cell wall biosynthesis
MKKYAIAINALSARQGGGQVYLWNILRFVQDYPMLQIYVLAAAEFSGMYDLPGVNIINSPVPSGNIITRTIWERAVLPKLLERYGIDLVFCPGGTINFAPPRGCKTAVAFQNMLIFDKENRRKYPLGYMRFRLAMLEKISRRSFRDADLLIFLSQYAKDVIDGQLPERKGRSVVIPHGLKERFRTAGRENLPRCKLIPDGQYLLYVSVITNFKAQMEVVRAYKILTQKRDTRENLLFVGPGYRKYEKLVRNEIKQLGLENKVFVIGQIPHAEMPLVYHYAKAHIFASTCENCPNVVIESLGSGRPIFLSNIQPMPEIAGDAAVYFNPYKPEELANLLLRYLDDQVWGKQIGQRAVERSANFNWAKTAHQTFDAFKYLFDEKTQEAQKTEKACLTV